VIQIRQARRLVRQNLAQHRTERRINIKIMQEEPGLRRSRDPGDAVRQVSGRFGFAFSRGALIIIPAAGYAATGMR
jgi:hypothetical protein